MSWLFGRQAELSAQIDRTFADAWLEHSNKADTVINEMFSTVDWGLKRRLEAKKKLTKKEQTQLFLIRGQINSAEVESAIHQNLAAAYGKRLGL